MKKLLIALAAVLVTVASYGQGQVVFGNKVGTAVDAPVFVQGVTPQVGPGPTWQAQLYVQNAGAFVPVPGALEPFRAAGTGAAAVADRYWAGNPTVDVPSVDAGQTGTFIVRAWPTALGTFDAAKTAGSFGESQSFQVVVGGGLNAPANLTTLQSFNVSTIPEPSILALGVLGASALLLRRRK